MITMRESENDKKKNKSSCKKSAFNHIYNDSSFTNVHSTKCSKQWKIYSNKKEKRYEFMYQSHIECIEYFIRIVEIILHFFRVLLHFRTIICNAQYL